MFKLNLLTKILFYYPIVKIILCQKDNSYTSIVLFKLPFLLIIVSLPCIDNHVKRSYNIMSQITQLNTSKLFKFHLKERSHRQDDN